MIFIKVAGHLLDFVSPVLTHLECQRLCEDSPGCLAWTFTKELNSEVEFGCILYSDIGRTTYQPHTISGPVSCVCSHQLACSASPDNEVGVSVGVMEVRPPRTRTGSDNKVPPRRICAVSNVTRLAGATTTPGTARETSWPSPASSCPPVIRPRPPAPSVTPGRPSVARPYQPPARQPSYEV